MPVILPKHSAFEIAIPQSSWPVTPRPSDELFMRDSMSVELQMIKAVDRCRTHGRVLL
ncbi:hypothetical protein CY34DRAFT_812790 [Suillus luteus UH-Slu-Lm8-n1]|uniref:Uncharacterized protein n=1 Tax=Suillus luteus UH-Slu-Lm8-n1 TaxID=930992 RepID=A0A0D0AK42_9AGAM|nr:hypothetical protein CY34DRAFT_812790 [Suillus luteus UH-Slu-Lm8-n1]